MKVGRNAVVPVSGNRRTRSPSRGVAVREIRSVVAVDLQVHQPRDQHAFGQADIGITGRRAGADLGDAAAV